MARKWIRYLWTLSLFFCKGYFDTARLELAEHNIHVQIVLPGPVKSNISRHFFTESVDEVRKQCFLIDIYSHVYMRLATLKVHLTPKTFFGRDETLQHSHKEFDNIISIWCF